MKQIGEAFNPKTDTVQRTLGAGERTEDSHGAQGTGRVGLVRGLQQIWQWLQRQHSRQQARKRLKVCETASLGEKRFVALVQVDCEQFLIGGSASSVSLLAQLPAAQSGEDSRSRTRLVQESA
jgi:flagellar biosynthesis protein FliO